MPESTSIAAIATAQAPSALGLIRCSGSLCGEIFPDLKPRLATLKTYRDRGGLPLDQVVAVFYKQGASFTGEASLELSAHGNPFILQKILDDLLSRGFQLAEPGEFTRRAFLNGRMDLTQAEAVAAVISAHSERALACAQAQLAGELGKRLGRLSEMLLSLVAETEATLSFSEHDEDVPEALPAFERLDNLVEQLETLQRTHKAHRITFEGARVVLAGAPNAGKSSLFNALLASDRAIVSPTAGTTRDYLSSTLTLGPHALTLVDTAGLNPLAERGSIEAQGIARAQEQLAGADVVIFVLDGTQKEPALPANLEKEKTIFVANKADLAGFQTRRGSGALELSCETGAGVAALKAALKERLDALIPETETLMVSARHAAALGECLEQLAMARGLLAKKAEAVFIAHHLRSALDSLGEILGRFDDEKILDRVFSTFCIGK